MSRAPLAGPTPALGALDAEAFRRAVSEIVAFASFRFEEGLRTGRSERAEEVRQLRGELVTTQQRLAQLARGQKVRPA